MEFKEYERYRSRTEKYGIGPPFMFTDNKLVRITNDQNIEPKNGAPIENPIPEEWELYYKDQPEIKMITIRVEASFYEALKERVRLEVEKFNKEFIR